MEFVHPKELFHKLDLEIRDSGEPDDKILNLCQETIRYSVHSGTLGYQFSFMKLLFAVVNLLLKRL